MPEPKTLLSIVELGGYENFTPLYRRLGYRVDTVTSGRKATAYLKAQQPAVIVAEFNFQPNFRDRTSNLESILATVQRMQAEGVQIVVFYDREFADRLELLRERFPGFSALPHPIDKAALEALLRTP